MFPTSKQVLGSIILFLIFAYAKIRSKPTPTLSENPSAAKPLNSSYEILMLLFILIIHFIHQKFIKYTKCELLCNNFEKK